MDEKQTFVFDKFMKDLKERQDSARVKHEKLEDDESRWSARELLRKYREHPMNLRVYEKQK